MASVRGKAEVRQLFATLPDQIKTKLLRGASRTAANVVAKEARERCISSAVAGAIKVKTDAVSDQAIARVQVKGRGSFMAPWLEYGTSPHVITAGDSDLSARALNARGKKGGIERLENGLVKVGGYTARTYTNKQGEETGSLVIKGKFVGGAVFHPGARPHPFLRPSLDLKAGEAVAAAQKYINARVSSRGITGTAED